jgi:hypothetical protein
MSDKLFERALHDWLEDGSDRTPLPAIEAVLLAVKTTPQERALRIPRRFTLMPTYLRIAALAAVVAIAGFGLMKFFGASPQVGGVPTTAPTATPAPTAAPTTAATATATALLSFTSPLYGYTVRYPGNYTVVPATTTWPAGDVPRPDITYSDYFTRPGRNLAGLAAQPVPKGMTPAQWMVDIAERLATSGRDCTGPASAWTDTQIAGVPARTVTVPCGDEPAVEGLWVIDGVGYNVSAPQDLFDAIVKSFAPPAKG